MDIGKIQKREITDEMSESYLDYAMSVIIMRALPDVRDGLKPVQRRILFSMHDLGLTHTAKFRKSASVVGDTIAKYHPHGEAAVYDALVRMAQDFSFRYPLVNGQGNFGSIDGDNAAAYRYTEARLTKVAGDLLSDLEKQTVDWRDNYDGTRKEPVVLPASFPQLLINGTTGIAVGMATNIPPHNMQEVLDAAIHLIDNPKATTHDLFEFVKGPDFPTGGEVYNRKEMIEAYSQGRGSFVMRARAEIKESEKGRGHHQILISEIPYQVNKAVLIETMAGLVRDKKVEGVKDIRDESDKAGLSIVVELRQDAYPQKVLNKFYKFTDLQKSYHLNMLALADGIQPQVLSLKGLLELWIVHRKEVIRRRTEFDLAQARERAHILEGLNKALSKIDAVIRLIKTSPTKEKAHEGLMKKFKFSDRQASAILEMRLQTLAGLERKRIEEELKERQKIIKELTLILKSPKGVVGVIKGEIKELRSVYTDPRRTHVFAGNVGEFSEEDLIPQEETIITLTHGGYIKRTPPESYKLQKRGGKGIIGLATKGEDVVEHFLTAFTHDMLLFFTSFGKVFRIPAYEIPEASRVSRGRALVNFLSGIDPKERVTAVISLAKDIEGAKHLVMATTQGVIKKTDISQFAEVRKSGLIALTLKGNDTLGWVGVTSGEDEILLVTKQGQAIHFREKDIRTMGRTAAGVRGMRLKKGDEVVGMEVVTKIAKTKRGEKGKKEAGVEEPTKGAIPYLLIVSEHGFGKRTQVAQFKIQSRGGSGTKAAKVTPKTGLIIASRVVSEEEELVVISEKGQVIRTLLKNIPVLGRATQGVKVMRLEPGDKSASITCF